MLFTFSWCNNSFVLFSAQRTCPILQPSRFQAAQFSFSFSYPLKKKLMEFIANPAANILYKFIIWYHFINVFFFFNFGLLFKELRILVAQRLHSHVVSSEGLQVISYQLLDFVHELMVSFALFQSCGSRDWMLTSKIWKNICLQCWTLEYTIHMIVSV